MSAGIYAARKKLKAILLAKELGGQLMEGYQIDNFLGHFGTPGVELVQKFADHLKKFDKIKSSGNYDLEIREGELVIKLERKDDYFSAQTEKNIYEGKTVIIATGKKQRVLDVPGAKQFEGKGISYCATCDAPLFRDKIVAVIGAGDSGQDTAWQLAQYAAKVYFINKYRELRGNNIALQEKIKSSGKIEIIGGVLPKEVRGEKFINELIFINPETKQEGSVKVEGVFVEIGSVPATDFLNRLLQLNQKGEIVVDHKTFAASVPGIFAAGDVADGLYKQITIGAGDGAKAMLSAYEYLKKK